MSRAGASFAVMLAGFAAFATATARADSGPVIVIPSRPGVPVIINGRDASYAVVEGDWGLARPGAVPVTVIGGSPILPNAVYTRRHSYHPKHGRVPERGRIEIEPAADRALPEPAESFSRSWSTSSDVAPANDTQRHYRAQPTNSSDADNLPATITDPIRTSARSLLIRGAGVVTPKELPRRHRGLNRRPRCGETRTTNGNIMSRRITLLALTASAALSVPTIYQYRDFAAAGGLLSYGGSLADSHRLAGIYTGRILKGEKPTDLPIIQSTKVELIINLKSAKALGITIPLPLLGRADEVIE